MAGTGRIDATWVHRALESEVSRDGRPGWHLHTAFCSLALGNPAALAAGGVFHSTGAARMGTGTALSAAYISLGCSHTHCHVWRKTHFLTNSLLQLFSRVKDEHAAMLHFLKLKCTSRWLGRVDSNFKALLLSDCNRGLRAVPMQRNVSPAICCFYKQQIQLLGTPLISFLC